MTEVRIFKSREEYFRWLNSKDDNIKITSVVNKSGEGTENSFHEAYDIYTVNTERRPASEHA